LVFTICEMNQQLVWGKRGGGGEEAGVCALPVTFFVGSFWRHP